MYLFACVYIQLILGIQLAQNYKYPEGCFVTSVQTRQVQYKSPTSHAGIGLLLILMNAYKLALSEYNMRWNLPSLLSDTWLTVTCNTATSMFSRPAWVWWTHLQRTAGWVLRWERAQQQSERSTAPACTPGEQRPGEPMVCSRHSTPSRMPADHAGDRLDYKIHN